MVDRYSSLAGVAQILLVISLVILICTKWNDLGIVMKILVIIGLSLFTIIQPLAFYRKASKAIDPNMPDTQLSFDDEYMTIEVQGHIQKIRYNNIVQVVSKPLLLIIQPDQKHIYILTKRILQNEKKELYKFLKSKIV